MTETAENITDIYIYISGENTDLYSLPFVPRNSRSMVNLFYIYFINLISIFFLS